MFCRTIKLYTELGGDYFDRRQVEQQRDYYVFFRADTEDSEVA
jgi:hypothetical protein